MEAACQMLSEAWDAAAIEEQGQWLMWDESSGKNSELKIRLAASILVDDMVHLSPHESFLAWSPAHSVPVCICVLCVR